MGTLADSAARGEPLDGIKRKSSISVICGNEKLKCIHKPEQKNDLHVTVPHIHHKITCGDFQIVFACLYSPYEMVNQDSLLRKEFTEPPPRWAWQKRNRQIWVREPISATHLPVGL